MQRHLAYVYMISKYANLIGQIVDLHGRCNDSTLSTLDFRILPHIEVPPFQVRRVLRQHYLGSVLHAADVEEFTVLSLSTLVQQPLLRRLQSRPRRQKLLQLTCVP